MLFKLFLDIKHNIRRARVRAHRIKILLARDGDTCGWCNKKLEIGLKVSIWRAFYTAIWKRRHKVVQHNQYVTIDHILPKYHGGGNEMSNLRLMHAKCNRLRGNKTGQQSKDRVLYEIKEWQGLPSPRKRKQNETIQTV